MISIRIFPLGINILKVSFKTFKASKEVSKNPKTLPTRRTRSKLLLG